MRAAPASILGRSRVVEPSDVIALCGQQARTVEQLALLTGLDLGEAAMALARLEHQGWLRETGGWFETIDAWGDLT